jgi:hypothetical protein
VAQFIIKKHCKYVSKNDINKYVRYIISFIRFLQFSIAYFQNLYMFLSNIKILRNESDDHKTMSTKKEYTKRLEVIFQPFLTMSYHVLE